MKIEGFCFVLFFPPKLCPRLHSKVSGRSQMRVHGFLFGSSLLPFCTCFFSWENFYNKISIMDSRVHVEDLIYKIGLITENILLLTFLGERLNKITQDLKTDVARTLQPGFLNFSLIVLHFELIPVYKILRYFELGRLWLETAPW